MAIDDKGVVGGEYVENREEELTCAVTRTLFAHTIWQPVKERQLGVEGSRSVTEERSQQRSKAHSTV